MEVNAILRRHRMRTGFPRAPRRRFPLTRCDGHKKNGRHSEEGACRLTKNHQALGGCTQRLDRYAELSARALRQKLVVGSVLYQHLIRRLNNKMVTVQPTWSYNSTFQDLAAPGVCRGTK
jgi:hypothetical protein